MSGPEGAQGPDLRQPALRPVPSVTPCPSLGPRRHPGPGADRQRSADTHLIRLEAPELAHVAVYLKDESIHPSGSLKHRLARSLFLHALCNGDLTEGMTVVEASSGSTAISEGVFCPPSGAVVPGRDPGRHRERQAARDRGDGRAGLSGRAWPGPERDGL